MPANDPELKARQAELGASAITCFGTAELLAKQGRTTEARLRARRSAVLRLCRDDRWPESVRQCVATADHDPLACLANLETDLQRAHWDPVFEHWVDP